MKELIKKIPIVFNNLEEIVGFRPLTEVELSKN